MVITICLSVMLLLLAAILCVLVDAVQYLKSIKRDISECERILYREERRQQYKK